MLDDSARARDQQHQLLAHSGSLLCGNRIHRPPRPSSGHPSRQECSSGKGGNVFLSPSFANVNVSAPFVYPTTAFDEKSKNPSIRRRGTNTAYCDQQTDISLQVLLRRCCSGGGYCTRRRRSRIHQLKVGFENPRVNPSRHHHPSIGSVGTSLIRIHY